MPDEVGPPTIEDLERLVLRAATKVRQFPGVRGVVVHVSDPWVAWEWMKPDGWLLIGGLKVTMTGAGTFRLRVEWNAYERRGRVRRPPLPPG